MAVWLTVFTVFVIFVVFVRPLFVVIVDSSVILAEFPSTVCFTSLKTVLSTLSPSEVSRLVVFVWSVEISPSVSVLNVAISSSNDSILLILPSAVVSLLSAAVTSESLMSCQLYVLPLFVKR